MLSEISSFKNLKNIYLFGVLFEGIATFLYSVSLASFIGSLGYAQYFYLRSLNLTCELCMYIVIGLMEIFIGYIFYTKIPSLSSVKFQELYSRVPKRILDLLLILLFLIGLEMIFALNLGSSFGLIASAAIFTLIVHPSLFNELNVNKDKILRSSLVFSGAILLAFGGFAGNVVILLTHLGVIALPLIIYSGFLLFKYLSPSFQHYEELAPSLYLLNKILLAIAVIAGGGSDIFGLSVIRMGGISILAALFYLFAGIAGIIVGILFLIKALSPYLGQERI